MQWKSLFEKIQTFLWEQTKVIEMNYDNRQGYLCKIYIFMEKLLRNVYNCKKRSKKTW